MVLDVTACFGNVCVKGVYKQAEKYISQWWNENVIALFLKDHVNMTDWLVTKLSTLLSLAVEGAI